MTAAAERRPAVRGGPNLAASRPRRSLMAALVLACLAASGCAQPPTVGAAIVAPMPPGEARIWVYRSFDPSESLNLATVAINGALAGYAQPGGGAFYRDVPPGRYHITVQSYGVDFNQSSNVDLAAGQVAYVKIETLNAWTTQGDLDSFKRDTFYARLVPAQLARVEIAGSRYYGGS
jgi:Protein of unknown function (DUF2846)